MRLIDADKIVEVAEHAYGEWNKAMGAAVRFRNVPARWFVYHTFPGGFPINRVQHEHTSRMVTHGTEFCKSVLQVNPLAEMPRGVYR